MACSPNVQKWSFLAFPIAVIILKNQKNKYHFLTSKQTKYLMIIFLDIGFFAINLAVYYV